MQASNDTAVRRSATIRPLLLAATALAVGIVLDRYSAAPLGASLQTWWVASITLVAAALVLRVYGKDRCYLGAILLAIVCSSGGWHHLRFHYFTHDNLARFATETSRPICIEAIAIGRIKRKPPPTDMALRAIPVGPSSELPLRVTRVRDGQIWRPASGECRLRIAGELEDVAAGDRVQLFALFDRITPALNPGQYDFARAERGAGRYVDLYCQSSACVSVVEAAAVAPLTRWVNQVGERCERRLARYVGPNNSDLAMAMLLGSRERLDQMTVDSFLKTGTVHLLVVSGLHVGMLAMAIWVVVGGGLLSRRMGMAVTVMLVVGYALVVGGRPPVIRAAVLVVLTLLAMIASRRVSMTNLLAAAALVVLLYNPNELFRAGTQLSFLCVAALAGFTRRVDLDQPLDPLTRLVRNSAPWHRKLRRWATTRLGVLAVASLIIWVVVAPLVAYHFHIATPIGVALTPLIWPLIAGALTTGLAICTVGWIVPPLASLLGAVCSLLLECTEWLVEFAGNITGGIFYCAGPALWWLLVFYAGLALPCFVPRLKLSSRAIVLLAMLWLAVGLFVAANKPTDDRLHCTFLAMGHGTCVVLELPGDQTILYDAGSLGSPNGASRTIAGYLWSRGITRIDAVVLSHADVDHYNAMPGLLERFDIGVVYVSPLMFDPWANDGRLTAPEYLRAAIEQAGVPLREIWMNDRLAADDSRIELEILHPPRHGVVGRDNANSLLLSVRFAGHSILLPGDLESPGIEAVTAEQPRDVDILLAPHHGSNRSDPPGFAAWCTPAWTIISGRQNANDHHLLTAASYRDVGAKVFHTADCGAARFSLSSEGIEVSTFCDP